MTTATLSGIISFLVLAFAIAQKTGLPKKLLDAWLARRRTIQLDTTSPPKSELEKLLERHRAERARLDSIHERLKKFFEKGE